MERRKRRDARREEEAIRRKQKGEINGRHCSGAMDGKLCIL